MLKLKQKFMFRRLSNYSLMVIIQRYETHL